MNAKPVRILLADDHSMVRQGFRRILEGQEGFEIVGEACDGMRMVFALALTVYAFVFSVPLRVMGKP